MKKLIFNLLLIVVILAVILFIVKDLAIKLAIEKGVEKFVGLKLEIGQVKTSLLKTSVDILDVRLHNPEGFEDAVMFYMPEIYVVYDLRAALDGKVHLNQMRLSMEEFAVVKDSRGRNNVSFLKAIKSAPPERKGAQGAEKKEAPKIRIDVLELRLKRVTFKDYSAGAAPSVKTFNLNIDGRYENINDAYTFVRIIVLEALKNTTISKLINLDLGPMQKMVSETVAGGITSGISSGKEIMGQTQEAAGQVIHGTHKNLRDALKAILPAREE